MPLVIIVECRGTDDSRLLTAAECVYNLSALQCDHDEVFVCRLRGKEDKTVGCVRLDIQSEVKPATRIFINSTTASKSSLKCNVKHKFLWCVDTII